MIYTGYQKEFWRYHFAEANRLARGWVCAWGCNK